VDGEIKRIIHDLRPPSLDALGLPPAIARYAEHFRTFSGLECRLQVSGKPRRLPSASETGIYRVMQEALQNAAAHAQASSISVGLSFLDRWVKLEVQDDGRGFDINQAPTPTDEHLGLAGMHERAQNLGGTLTIDSARGAGTRVSLSVYDIGDEVEEQGDGREQGADPHPGG
jgi:signal transduction histidine kinase